MIFTFNHSQTILKGFLLPPREGETRDYKDGKYKYINGEWKKIKEEDKKNILKKDVFGKSEGYDKQIPLTDVDGNKIMTASEWNNLTKTQQNKLKQTKQKSVIDKKGDKFNVDFGIAFFLQRILNLGVKTGQSDSGMKSDHPNYRNVDEESNKYGELIYSYEPGTSAYLTFWKPEAIQLKKNGKDINTQEQINAIRKAAKDAGFIIEDGKTFFQPSLIIRLPETNNGKGSSEILKEANILTNRTHPEFGIVGDKAPYGDRFMEWLDIRNKKIIPIVMKNNGGGKFYTDLEVANKWNQLIINLEKSLGKS